MDGVLNLPEGMLWYRYMYIFEISIYKRLSRPSNIPVIRWVRLGIHLGIDHPRLGVAGWNQWGHCLCIFIGKP